MSDSLFGALASLGLACRKMALRRREGGACHPSVSFLTYEILSEFGRGGSDSAIRGEWAGPILPCRARQGTRKLILSMPLSIPKKKYWPPSGRPTSSSSGSRYPLGHFLTSALRQGCLLRSRAPGKNLSRWVPVPLWLDRPQLGTPLARERLGLQGLFGRFRHWLFVTH